MHEITTATRTSSLAEPSPAAERPDLYSAVHKGLRAALADALVTVGATDPSDPRQWEHAAATLASLLMLCEKHLHHEDLFVEAALVARVARTAPSTADDHLEHAEHIAALRARIEEVSRAPVARRAAPMKRLYRELAHFVAENFLHMEREETENNAALWAAYSDDELHAIEHALISQIPPDVMQVFLSWMLPSFHHGERVGMLSGVRDNAPPEVLAGMLSVAESRLDAESFAALRAALG